MLNGKQVLIVSPDQLQCIGLKTVLQEFFNPGDVLISGTFNNKLFSYSADYIFMPSDIYLAHMPLKVKSKIIILTDYIAPDRTQENPYMLNINSTQTDLIEQLQQIFKNDHNEQAVSSHQEELSLRENEVLKLVARGYINKQIADELYISLHTVISHRKNITRKLGIKTVSGLTVYALLNGLITSEEIE